MGFARELAPKYGAPQTWRCIRPAAEAISANWQHICSTMRKGERWSMDLERQPSANGQTLRVFPMVDDYTRSASMIKPGKPVQNVFVESFNSACVMRALSRQLVLQR